MWGSPAAPSDGGLVGRERERAEIKTLLAAAGEGEGSAMVLLGEAGIGKSALLELALHPQSDVTVLAVRGVEAESDLAFAGLLGLLRPVLGALGELPAIQARALEGALGLAASADPDRFLVASAVLALLSTAAERLPVICVVDDAHWLDTPSADALVFAARRLKGERIAMLFAAREGEPRGFPAEGLEKIPLHGLDRDDAARLLEASAPRAVPGVRSRLLAEAAGNPLALLEMPTALSEEQLAGRVALPEAMPLTPRLGVVFRERVEAMPADTRQALLVAALDGTGEHAVLARALSEMGLALDALNAAERDGLIHIRGGRVEFRHPLARAAVYEHSVAGNRRAAHATLAKVLSGDEHVDRRVWHQAMAAVGPDEEVATALEASARRARRRAGHASAATAFERAAELSGDPARRAPRLASAAEAAWDAGQPERALELVDRLLPVADRPLRARSLYLRGVIQARRGSAREAAATLMAGAAEAEPTLALAMLHEAAECVGAIGQLEAVRDIGQRAAELRADGVRAQFSKRVLVGASALVGGELEHARETLDGALELVGELEDDPRVQIWAANAAGGEPGTGLPHTSKAVEIARSEGLFSVLPLALAHHAKELLRSGRLDLAYAAAEEGYSLSVELGHGAGWHLATLAYVEALRGQDREAREHVEEALALAQRSGDIYLEAGARAALGLLELTLGRPVEAAEVLLEITTSKRSDLTFVATVGPAADAVEAIVRGGVEVWRADRPLSLLRDWATHDPTDANRAILARCEALLCARGPEEAFEEAVGLSRALTPVERARTLLAYGEWLRRQRRRADARPHLREAGELFRSLVASPWAERAENELRASGETARKRDVSTLDDLTAQELQVAGLAASGLTNREIAAQLFISPRTVEYHLRKVFTKLGIKSRTELIRREGLSIVSV